MTPPAVATSLLVPVHLDAWVVDSTNQEVWTSYSANYDNLTSFDSPIEADSAGKPPLGVHLQWALPDALTHGRKAGASSGVEFPLVPDRWLVLRFADGWEATAWVVESDYVGSDGTSPYLDPHDASGMTAPLNETPVFRVNSVGIGKSHTITDWEANPAPATAKPYLTATGPANVSFAAYSGFAQDVFSFVDPAGDLPADGTGEHRYTYMVVGWYSDPAGTDPLRGVSAYVPGTLWKDDATWQAQTPAERFATIIGDASWSVTGDLPDDPPSTSLYHGAVAAVQWPAGDQGDPKPSTDGVTIAIGNTSTDALAALIQAYANQQAASDAPDAGAWTAAGSELAGLVEAAMLDTLDSFGTPGGAVLLRQAIQKSWFGSSPGGTLWEVVATAPVVAGQDAATPQLTPDQSAALVKQLAALNASQRELDQQQRQLASLQEALYGMWLRVARANSYGSGWGEQPVTTPTWDKLNPFLQGTVYPQLFDTVWDQLCSVNGMAAALPDPIDPAAAGKWADAQWSFPLAGGDATTLSELGLALKSVPEPPFWHPTDPVVMISGLDRSQRHGEDGRYNADGTMTCRLPGQIVDGVQVAGQPLVSAAALEAKGVGIDPLAQYTQIPSLSGLVGEAFMIDPSNATAMAGAVGGDADAIQTGIEALLGGDPANGDSWSGTPPAPFSTALWAQAWAPLFLDWSVQYYPTGSGAGEGRPFTIGDWRFDGQDMIWQGTGVDEDDALAYNGRTLLTPQAPLLLQQKIAAYLKAHTTLDTTQMEDLIATVGSWDVLSQTLSGFTDQMITLLSQEIFPPDASEGMAVTCPRAASGQSKPSPAALIGDQYRYLPVLLRSRGAGVSDFYPVRGGFLQFPTWAEGNFAEFAVVDAFGQRFPLASANTGQGFVPAIAQGLVPDADTPSPGMAQLPPRIVQDARLDFRFLSSDGSGKDIAVADDPNPVCGWLLPNHLDGGIAIYDGGGVMLGEVIALPAPDNWRPRPGDPGPQPPPAHPSDIANPVLRAVVESIAGQTVDVFGDVLDTIDETLWMVDPLGGRKDQFLSVLFGRPLAVVQAGIGLSLMGGPATDQSWDALVADPGAQPADYDWNRDPGDVVDVPFPVRLGNLDLRADGLIGYYLPSESYGTFRTVHLPDELSRGDEYLEQIATPTGTYQGNFAVHAGAAPTTVTLVLDPRGPVHAFTGILPVTSSALPAYLVEQFIRQLAVTFRTGPVVADPGTLRIPLPGRQSGAWDWVQATPNGWEEDHVVAADDVARLPDAQLQLREGWLRLTEVDDS